jgi:hypothetical protein
MLTRELVLSALRNVSGVPSVKRRGGGPDRMRSIYESGDMRGRSSGRFHIDYASFPGGTTEEVPIALIRELEAEGLIVRAFPSEPHINSWVLNPANSTKEFHGLGPRSKQSSES